ADGNSITDVSCNQGLCAAVDNAGYAILWDGMTWEPAQAIDTGSSFVAVSCTFSDSCVAVDSHGTGFFARGDIIDLTRGVAPKWLPSVKIDSAGTPTDISCPSPYFCAAVDASGNAVMFNGDSWAEPALIDSQAGLTSVSCPSATSCIAVDSA